MYWHFIFYLLSLCFYSYISISLYIHTVRRPLISPPAGGYRIGIYISIFRCHRRYLFLSLSLSLFVYHINKPRRRPRLTRQESGRRYTVFVDPTAAIDRVRSDSIGPGQRFAVATIEACIRILARDNEVSIRWVLAHHRALGAEKADEYAKAAAEGGEPDSAVPDEYRWETSLSHMRIVVTRPGPRRLPSGPETASGRREGIDPPWGGVSGAGSSEERKVSRQPVLPASVRSRGNRPIPQEPGPQGGG